MKLRIGFVVVGFLSLVLSLVRLTFAQMPTHTASALPRLVRFSGAVKDLGGTPLTGVVGITFTLYSEQTGGSALWLETQNVTADRNGHYTALLGSTKPDGLPPDLFTSEQARWVGVQVSGQPEQPRVLLLSVPYALKAADAETVGGLPASAFVLAAPPLPTSTTNAETPAATAPQPLATGTTPVTTAGGTVNKLAKFDAKADITNSLVFDNGTNVGVGNTAPAAKLDVSGTGIFRGALTLPATGAATATAGTNSQPLNFTASSFSSSTLKAVNETFRWQAEPVGNKSATPLGKLNLLFGSGTAAPSETGLSISNKGAITFASGQTFPASVGTVKSVGLSAPSSDFTVSGSPVTSAGTLNFAWKVVPTSADNANAIVKRDANGAFAAGGITSSSAGVGVLGQSFGTNAVSDGVDGVTGSASASGVAGINNSVCCGGVGVYGTGGTGVAGINNSAGVGVYGTGGTGVWGISPCCTGVIGQGGTYGVYGEGPAGGTAVVAINDNGGDGIYARASNGGYGIYAVVSNGGFAGFFLGDVDVDGNLSKAGGSFKIDHPLDPADKYLYHSFVESPDMMNIYNGNVNTDAQGNAIVQMPEWFETLNRDFRYQLTVIGQFAQAIVARKIANNRFSIKTDKPNVEVSWQVTGVRQDAWANAHRIPIEQVKPERERGFYLHPELFGAPEEKSIAWARHPETMKRAKEKNPLPPLFTKH